MSVENVENPDKDTGKNTDKNSFWEDFCTGLGQGFASGVIAGSFLSVSYLIVRLCCRC